MTGLTSKSKVAKSKPAQPRRTIQPEERSQEVDHPSSQLAMFGADQPLKLDCGTDLAPFQIAYQTYG